MHEMGLTNGEMRTALLQGVRLDGMRLCAGCEEVFVLEGYCGECERIAAALETRRLEAEERRVHLFRSLPRVEVPTAAEYAPDCMKKIGLAPAVAIAFSTAVLACGVGAGLWYGIRGLVSLGLWLSK